MARWRGFHLDKLPATKATKEQAPTQEPKPWWSRLNPVYADGVWVAIDGPVLQMHLAKANSYGCRCHGLMDGKSIWQAFRSVVAERRNLLQTRAMEGTFLKPWFAKRPLLFPTAVTHQLRFCLEPNQWQSFTRDITGGVGKHHKTQLFKIHGNLYDPLHGMHFVHRRNKMIHIISSRSIFQLHTVMIYSRRKSINTMVGPCRHRSDQLLLCPDDATNPVRPTQRQKHFLCCPKWVTTCHYSQHGRTTKQTS